MPPRSKITKATKPGKGDPLKANKHRIYMQAVKMVALKRFAKATKHRNVSRLIDALVGPWVRKNAPQFRKWRLPIPAEFFN